MNREIKFRAWDKEKKIMIQDQDQKAAKIYDIPLGAYIPNTVRKIGDYYGTYMQFTGLHDSAGKEIYEGDIMEFKGATTEIGEIVWMENPIFGWAHKNEKGTFFLIEPHKYNVEIKVLGNIHENPELLGKIHATNLPNQLHKRRLVKKISL